MTESASQEGAEALPFVAPCRTLDARAALGWIALGWRDLTRAPRQSLTYGVVIMLMSWAVTLIGWRFGSYWVVLTLLSGFVFVAPVLAIGLYSISRQLSRDEHPSLRRCLAEQRDNVATLMVFALVLLVVFLVWARAGSMVHVFFPVDAHPDWRALSVFLGVGSAVGSMFAAITFACSAFALPMIADREVDAVTAVVTSFNAVLRNKRAMLVWSGTIVALTALGFITGLVGLAVVIPLLGHATWHAYRDTIDAEAWAPR
jgi:uncharacterized membrane protein